MSGIIRFGVLLLLFISCHPKEIEVASPVKREAPYFSPEIIVSTLNALVAIIDWPEATKAHQKNLNVTPETAQKLILPLHPLYDEKINEVAAQIPGWSKDKVVSTLNECQSKCHCEFYQEILDRHPQILENAIPELKNFAGSKIVKSKESVLKCLEQLPSVQDLLKYLDQERKNYEADSAI